MSVDPFSRNTEFRDLSVDSVSTVADDFPLLGVNLSYLTLFIEECGGKDALALMTTTDVCEEFVKPRTLKPQCPMRAMVDSSMTGTASWFISHAWKFKFLDVVEAITLFFNNRTEENPVIWFDLFCNYQHDTQSRPFEWWTNTFSNAIAAMKNVVVIMMPWNMPLPLTRTWCIFEIFACEHKKANFHVAMTQDEQDRFLSTLRSQPEAFFKMLSEVSARKSEAFHASDRDKIFKAIEESVGFVQLDSMVFRVFERCVFLPSFSKILNTTELLVNSATLQMYCVHDVSPFHHSC
jgi:hypothetical protein